MKHKILIFVVAICLFNVAVAQNDKLFTIKNVEVTRIGGTAFEGGDVVVNFTVQPSRKIRVSENLTITPVLVGQSESMTLTPIQFSRRQAVVNEWRTGKLPSTTTIIASTKEPLVYTAAFPYQDWMNESSLKINSELYRCARTDFLSSYFVASSFKLVDERRDPVLTYFEPKVEEVKRRELSGTAYLEFKVGKWELLPYFANNAAELDKINATIEMVKTDDDIRSVKNIALWGTCSPEGSYEFNAQLAQNRVMSVREYIQNRYLYPFDIFTVTSTPENWAGLRAAVEKSTLYNRGEILSIIDSGYSPEMMDRKMSALPNYRELLDYYYPPLRRVDYRINYVVEQLDLQRSVSIYEKQPRDMSLNELYILAMSYGENSVKFVDVIRMSVLLFDDSAEANVNAAVSAVAQGKYSAAKGYLDVAKSEIFNSGSNSNNRLLESVYYNTLGVWALFTGNEALASESISRAAAMGLKAAVDNLPLVL